MEFLEAYFLTLLIEISILYLRLRNRYRIQIIGQNGFIASTITLPFVWFVFPKLGLSWQTYIILAEAFAFVVETIIYRKLFEKISWKDAIIVSFLCNGSSFFLGSLIGG